jgi:hypothetical protein
MKMEKEVAKLKDSRGLIIGLGVVAIAGLGIWYFVSQSKKNKTTQTTTTTPASTPTISLQGNTIKKDTMLGFSFSNFAPNSGIDFVATQTGKGAEGLSNSSGAGGVFDFTDNDAPGIYTLKLTDNAGNSASVAFQVTG